MTDVKHSEYEQSADEVYLYIPKYIIDSTCKTLSTLSNVNVRYDSDCQKMKDEAIETMKVGIGHIMDILYPYSLPLHEQ